jgi:mannose-6-phosphate isomerase
MTASLLPLTPFVQSYAWGSCSALAEFLRIAPTGTPMAEAWFGVHPAGPSTVAVDGADRSLADLLDGSGIRMPFLLKVLAIAAPLSLQLHPTLEKAQTGFDEENRRGIPLTDPTRVFRDANHKPELICALTELDALCGFRSPTEAVELLRAVGGRPAERVVHEIQLGTATRDIIRRLLTPGDELLGRGEGDRVVVSGTSAAVGFLAGDARSRVPG